MAEYITLLVIILLILVSYVNISVVNAFQFQGHRHSNTNKSSNNSVDKIDNVFVFLGSGGHTGEMLKILENYMQVLSKGTLYVCYSDETSFVNFNKRFPHTEKSSALAKTNIKYIQLNKAREVGSGKLQSLLSIVSTMVNIVLNLTVPLCSATVYNDLFHRNQKSVFLLNGPGTSVLISVYVRVFQVLSNILTFSKQCSMIFNKTNGGSSKSIKIIYIESLARVTRLSLSGLIIYYAKLYDDFIVQWEELTKEYPDSKYYGILV